MLSLLANSPIYLCRDAVDMRKSIDGLSSLVTGALRLDAKSSALFVFFNKRRDKVKILYWDRSGFVIWYKRLAKGRYRPPHLTKSAAKLSISDLTGILEGMDLLSPGRYRQY